VRFARLGLAVTLSALTLLATSCGLTPSVKPTVTPTPTVLVRPSPTPSPTPTPPATASPTNTATATASATSEASGFGVITADALRVRGGAGTGFAVITVVQRGAVFPVLEKQPDEQGQTWFRVGEGQWVHGGYVDLYPTQSEADAASAVLTGGGN
jgi:hypothetical protein